MTNYICKQPEPSFLNLFLSDSIQKARGYGIDVSEGACKLDQNESPWDWPEDIKRRILERLLKTPWNRYPSSFADDIAAKIAHTVGVTPQSILLGPGSNYLLALLIQTLKQRRIGRFVVARPSFALYESQLQYEDLPYDPWPLDQNLEYDCSLLPKLSRGSVVLFASPNNPVGNALSRKDLKGLLAANPEVLFIGDEAYTEFSSENYAPLLTDHANLLLVRTFSKTLAAAGARLGYVLGHEHFITQLRKPRVPYLINYFGLVVADEVMSHPHIRDHFLGRVNLVIEERNNLFTHLQDLGKQAGFSPKNSNANFLLLRWANQEGATKIYEALKKENVQVRDVSKGAGLEGCLRVTIGTKEENALFLRVMHKVSSAIPRQPRQ